nr:MAG TPA: hypothetical protein [Caudoviricetes sp.]
MKFYKRKITNSLGVVRYFSSLIGVINYVIKVKRK